MQNILLCIYQISEEQENIEKKAKTTIETATAKCKNIEEKMKVLHVVQVFTI